MEGMNAFIDSYQGRCNDFFEQCCIDPESLKKLEEQNEWESNIALVKSRVSQEVREEALNIHFVIVSNEDKIVNYIKTHFKNADQGVYSWLCHSIYHQFSRINTYVRTHARLAVIYDFKSFLKNLPEVQDYPQRGQKIPEVPTGSSDASTSERRSASEERYLALLEKAKETPTQDLDKQYIIKFCGKDKQGLPIAIFNEENIKKEDLERVLLYIVKTMDEFVNNDYTLVWCVSSTSQSRPGLAWMFNVYKTLSRKYVVSSSCVYCIVEPL